MNLLAANWDTGLVTLAIIGVAYFLPSIIAAGRKVPNQGSIAVINVFLGWTFVGWVVALAMAARSVPAQPATFTEETMWPPKTPTQ